MLTLITWKDEVGWGQRASGTSGFMDSNDVSEGLCHTPALSSVFLFVFTSFLVATIGLPDDHEQLQAYLHPAAVRLCLSVGQVLTNLALAS